MEWNTNQSDKNNNSIKITIDIELFKRACLNNHLMIQLIERTRYAMNTIFKFLGALDSPKIILSIVIPIHMYFLYMI